MNDKKLAQAAVYLRNAAPEQWEAFCRAVEDIANESTHVLVGARAEHIMSNQGWAQCALWFLRCFKDCDARVRAPTKPATVDHHPV